MRARFSKVYAARSAPELSRGQRQRPATGQCHREGKVSTETFRLVGRKYYVRYKCTRHSFDETKQSDILLYKFAISVFLRRAELAIIESALGCRAGKTLTWGQLWEALPRSWRGTMARRKSGIQC